MTPNVMAWVARLNLSGKILDVGSFDVNGSVKGYFDDYTGLDMRPGPNVNCVASSHEIPFPDNFFDNVLCLEMLEHDNEFWRSIAEMKRVLKPGGRLAISTRGIGFPKHEYPFDYYRFTEDALKSLFWDMVDVTAFEIASEFGVFAVGKKLK